MLESTIRRRPLCVVCATHVVTRSDPMDKFVECSEPTGNYRWACCSRNGEMICWGFRFSGITLLGEIGQCQCRRKKAIFISELTHGKASKRFLKFLCFLAGNSFLVCEINFERVCRVSHQSFEKVVHLSFQNWITGEERIPREKTKKIKNAY